MSSTIRASLYIAGAWLLIVFAVRMAILVAFPIGGGEYHAIFAYSETGRISVAIFTYAVYTGAAALTVMALRIHRYALPWWVLALVGLYVLLSEWYGVFAWTPTSSAFRGIALAGLAFGPVTVFGLAWLAELGARKLELRRATLGRRDVRDRLVSVVSGAVLVAPIAILGAATVLWLGVGRG